MKFNDAAAVDQIAYEMRLADYPRSLDRTRINELFNGCPPYSQSEVEENGIAINVNFLEATTLGHDARMQFTGNFLRPGRFFACTTDMGAPHKRSDRGDIVTREIARIMKRSTPYYECFRGKFANLLLHGPGPCGWDSDDRWCPEDYGLEDVLVPAQTKLHMKNLPFFILYHSYTLPELKRLTSDEKVASAAGWNIPLLHKCYEYVDRETMALTHNNWPEVWSPEKMQERIKGDAGFYASDAVPTIDCFDFYFWDDDKKTEGWKRRLILDSWSTPEGSGGSYSMQRNPKLEFGKGEFLFTSKNRNVASTWKNVVSWQFADLSAVAPFHYHTVRGLGYLMYAVCNLQNRLRCKFAESVFEALMMYFRVKAPDEVQRALKVELLNRGFIDESLQFIPASDRFQVNAQLVELGLRENTQLINKHSSSWSSSNQQFQDRTERTKFQVMAELQMMTAMVSAGMDQAYRYQVWEYQEIFRRFCLKHSRDPDVIEFRTRCLQQGVPERMLVSEAWNIEPERVLGAGNKTLQMAAAEQLMAFRHLYDPEPQRQILRDFTFAITDDPGRTEALVPQQATQITDSVMLAQSGTATLMLGLPWAVKTGINHIEYVEAMMVSLTAEVQKIQQRGGVPTPDELQGLMSIFQHLAQHINFVAQDPAEKQRVKQWGDMLKKLGNLVKAFGQRLQEMQQKAAQQAGGGEGDAETASKIKANLITAQAKAANTRESHAQRTAQRQIAFEMEQQQKEQQHMLEMRRKAQEQGLDLEAKRVGHAQDIVAEDQKQRLRSTAEEE